MARELPRTKPELDDDEDNAGLEEFKPARGRVTKAVTSSGIQSGWSSDKRPRSTGTGIKVERFKVPDDGEEVLIKFLDEMPFAPVFQHWIMSEGQRRAYTCLEDGCPLCARGDKAKSSDWFNVVELGETPELKVWYATADPAAAIREKSETKRYSPINRDELYFAVSKRKGTNGFNSYTIDAVKEAELVVDWGIKPLSPEQLAKFNSEKYDGSLVRIHTVSELSELARKYLED